MIIGQNREKELNQHLMLFFTGVVRTAEEVANSYVRDIDENEKQLRSMQKMVGEAIAILTGGGSLEDFGELLHKAWLHKRSLSKLVSNQYLDELYYVARKAGAIGGKLCGAGGGGFMLLLVPPEKQSDVKKKFEKLIHVPFNFEYGGSQIMYSDQQQRYFEEEKSREQNQKSPFIELNNL